MGTDKAVADGGEAVAAVAALGSRLARRYPGCRHGLDQCRDDLDRDRTAWLREVAGLRATW